MNLCGLTTCRFNKDNICTSEADFGICRKAGVLLGIREE